MHAAETGETWLCGEDGTNKFNAWSPSNELRLKYLVANYPRIVFVGYNPSDLHGISRVNPLIIGVITHLLSGMSHQVAQINRYR